VDSRSIIIHEEIEVKFKATGNTREVQFSAGVSKKCPIQNISKDKYLDKNEKERQDVSRICLNLLHMIGWVGVLRLIKKNSKGNILLFEIGTADVLEIPCNSVQ
jgi:hypothetical protein